MTRHRWMAYMPYEITAEDGLRMIGAMPMKGADLPDTELAGDDRPAPGDERPYFGTHNLVRDLVAVGCFTCEQPLTPEAAATDCPGEPTMAERLAGGSSEPVTESSGNVSGDALQSVRRNDPCPCGSGQKFKRCHGA